MKVCPIASGSSGNCIYVGEGKEGILIDAGISRKRIVEGLKSIGVMPEELRGICITHEHSDHIAGLRVFAKQYHTPLYATAGTFAFLQDKMGEVLSECTCHIVEAGKAFSIDRIRMQALAISHDAAEPVAYTVQIGECKFGMATDLGFYDEGTLDFLQGSQILLLEANHDISMLQAGTYPYQLKRRILGNKGHLSNTAAGDLLCALLHDTLRHVYLAHLSKENNYPELAYETVRCRLRLHAGLEQYPFSMAVAKRNEPSCMVNSQNFDRAICKVV